MAKIYSIYCDFDGTITKGDSVNAFYEIYAHKDWLYYENLWVEGKITSRENTIKQVGLLPKIKKSDFDDYIDSIEIDDFFLDFVEYVKSKNIKLTILSDGFDLFIEKTLEKYKIKNIPFYANHLIYENEKFRIEFPYHNIKCAKGSGMCKCDKVKEDKFCYIGDGISDLCIAQKADLLFATKNLHKFCEENLIKHSHFNSFRNIIDMLQSI